MALAFNHWWLQHGQFLPPLDKVTDKETLDLFRKYTQNVYKDLEEEFDDTKYEPVN